MSLVIDHALSAREFLDECVAFKRDHGPRSNFLRGLVMGKLTAAQVAWEASNQAFQVFGGMAYSKELPVERLFRDARIGKNIPVSEELVLAHIATHALGLPKSY